MYFDMMSPSHLLLLDSKPKLSKNMTNVDRNWILALDT